MSLARVSVILGRFLLIPLIGFTAFAQDLSIRGQVTYLLTETVYVSAGRTAGLADSALVYVLRGKDTVATLKVLAVSSKSAACRYISKKKDLAVGDSIIAIIPTPEAKVSAGTSPADFTTAATNPAASMNEKPSVAVRGRIGLQYFTSRFENSAYNIEQPALVVGVRAAARDVPVALEIYGNLRRLSRKGTGTATRVSDESRIYRFSLVYDDTTNEIALGRILPEYAPSIGSIDGVSYGRRFGAFLLGVSAGFQPDIKLQGVSTDVRRIALFAHYRQPEFYNLGLTAAYGRTYYLSSLDREVVTLGVTAYSSDGLSVYGYGDIDLRRKDGALYTLSPTVSSGIFSVNYRLFDMLSIGVGADASRLVYQFSTVRYLEDSLVDQSLRSGANLTLTLSLPNGFMLNNSYTPRSSGGTFGREFSNVSSVSWFNALSTGISLRGTFNLTTNSFVDARGYGMNVQRNLFGVDCTVRYQQSSYTVARLGERNSSRTFGVDLMALLTRRLSFVLSYDALRGYGSTMNSVFTEISWRF